MSGGGGGCAPAAMTLMSYPIYHHRDVHVVRFSWKIGDDFPLTYIIVPTILPGLICISINSERFRSHIELLRTDWTLDDEDDDDGDDDNKTPGEWVLNFFAL